MLSPPRTRTPAAVPAAREVVLPPHELLRMIRRGGRALGVEAVVVFGRVFVVTIVAAVVATGVVATGVVAPVFLPRVRPRVGVASGHVDEGGRVKWYFVWNAGYNIILNDVIGLRCVEGDVIIAAAAADVGDGDEDEDDDDAFAHWVESNNGGWMEVQYNTIVESITII